MAHPAQGPGGRRIGGVIERNPAVKGTAPRVALKERAALTPDQAADLIAAETDDAWRLMWMLAFMTGMRQGERLGLMSFVK